MRRIGLAVVLAVSFILAPLAVEAQQSGKIARIAFLSTTPSPESPTTAAFRQGLQELGYVEGQNIIVEWRWGGGRTEQFPAFASEVVQLNVDVIVAANDAAGRAAQQATNRIPIVIATMADPVGSGFVNSLARPGGNITGLSTQAPELAAKRLQLLKEAVPHVSRVALLADTNDLGHRQAAAAVEAAARTLGVQLRRYAVSSRHELNDVFATMVKGRLPMMCGPRETMHTGCLISYSAALTDRFRRAASFVDKILKGAKPADLPVEQPTKVPLVIDFKTATALRPHARSGRGSTTFRNWARRGTVWRARLWTARPAE